MVRFKESYCEECDISRIDTYSKLTIKHLVDGTIIYELEVYECNKMTTVYFGQDLKELIKFAPEENAPIVTVRELKAVIEE